MKKFSGFNPRQMELISKKLGYNGPSEGFQDYLNNTPDKAAKLTRMNDRARQRVEGGGYQEQTNTGPAMGKAPPDNQMLVQGGRVITPQEQQIQSTMPMPPDGGGGLAQQPMNKPAVMPQQPMPQQGISPMMPMPQSSQLPNPAMPNWSKLPEGDQISGQTPVMPQQKPVGEVQYMAEGGDVKKKDKKDDGKKDDKKKEKEPEPKPFENATPLTKEVVKRPEQFITDVDAEKVDTKDGQFIKNKGNVVNNTSVVKNTATGEATDAEAAPTTDAHTVDTATSQEGVQGVVDNTQAAQGTVSQNAQVQAATALPSANATVQGQLEGLMKQFEGGETPAWAAGAMRMANTAMASRGLGSSSMAGGAVTQAAMESAIKIAAQDAATFSQFEMQNLNNRQQARLVNAQAFLQMDMANLNNRQQTEMFKSQALIQSLFTDQAAENATKQFNASSQNQTDQFFANLSTQVSTFNSAQKNAMSMFNSEQTNAVKMFNTEQKNAIKQFNAQNRLVIDQSNAQWRQQIATINNANINEANRINAQAATGLTMAGFNNLWQGERDLMAYAFTAAENMNQRAHEILLAKMGVDSDKDLADQASRDALMEVAGQFVGSLFS